MKVKARNLIEVILQASLIILMFFHPFFVQWDYHRVLAPDALIDNTTSQSYDYSLFSTAFQMPLYFEKAIVFVWILICVCLAGLVIYILQFLGKGEKRNWRLTIIFSVIQSLALIVLSLVGSLLTGDSNTSFNKDYSIMWKDWTYYDLGGVFIAFAIVQAILIAVTFIGYFITKKRGIIDENPITTAVSYVKEESNLDKIEKLKKLLDSGAITEEEYMVKKKQLLEE